MEAGAQGLDGAVVQAFGLAPTTHDPMHAGHLKHTNPLRVSHSNEYVAGKQRALQFHAAPILPVAGKPVERQKRFDLPHGKVLGHPFLPAGGGVGGVPARVGQRGRERHLRVRVANQSQGFAIAS